MKKETDSSAAHAAKKLARLAAVQALYQSAFEQQPIEQAVRESLENKFASLREDDAEAAEGSVMPDHDLFREIAEGAAANKGDLDAMIASALDAGRSFDRLEALLQAILRAGAFELFRHGTVPAGVIINDYVDVTHAFFDGKEPGLINGILDKLASKLRER